MNHTQAVEVVVLLLAVAFVGLCSLIMLGLIATRIVSIQHWLIRVHDKLPERK